MISMLAVAAVLSGLGAIAADARHRHHVFHVLKPLTTVLIIGLAALAPASAGQHWVLLALALSLCGDVALMFEGRRGFMTGLAAFFFAHLAFVIAFLSGVRHVELPAWLAAVVAYAVVLLVPRAGSLKMPVIAYCVALGAMVFAAAARHAQLQDPASAMTLGGALLFLLSDSLLAWRKFRGDYPGAQAAILSTYWLAIGLVAVSA